MENTFQRDNATRYVIHIIEDNDVLFRIFTDSRLLTSVLNDLHKEYETIRVYAIGKDFEEVK